MAIGVPGRTEYGASSESVWCSLTGDGLVRVEIRRSDQESILYTPQQASELAKVLQELAGSVEGYRVTEES